MKSSTASLEKSKAESPSQVQMFLKGKQMKTYKVKASYVVYLETTVKAKSLEEAQELAGDLDGGSFTEIASDDWMIDDVVEAN